MHRWLVLFGLLLLPSPAHALPLQRATLALTYCFRAVYALEPTNLTHCTDLGVPATMDVLVSAQPGAVFLLDRAQYPALGIPLGEKVDYVSALTQAVYSTDWLYWGPLGLDVGVALEAITLAPREDDPPLTKNPEPATLALLGTTLAGLGWRIRRRRCVA